MGVESLQRLSVHLFDCKWDNGVSFISLAMDRVQIDGFMIDHCIKLFKQVDCTLDPE